VSSKRNCDHQCGWPWDDKRRVYVCRDCNVPMLDGEGDPCSAEAGQEVARARRIKAERADQPEQQPGTEGKNE
jgi:hypothetical protein